MSFQYNSTRTEGKHILKSILTKEHNINIIEKYIHRNVIKHITEKYNEDSYEAIYKELLYEIYNHITYNKDLQQTLSKLKNNDVLFNNQIYDAKKNIIEEHDEFIVNPFEVEEGVTQCHKCNSKRVFTISKQVRSSDEPMTTFAECCNCRAKWTYSG